MRRAGGVSGGSGLGDGERGRLALGEGERELERERERAGAEREIEAEGLISGEEWEKIRHQWRRPEDYLHHPSYRHEFPNFPPRIRTREKSKGERSRARSVEVERRRKWSDKEVESVEPENKQKSWLLPPLPHTMVSNFSRKAQSRQSKKAEKKASVAQRLNTSGESGLDSPQVSRPGSPTGRSRRSTVKTLGAWARNLTKGNRSEITEAEAEDFPQLSVGNFSKSDEGGDSGPKVQLVRSYADVVQSPLQPVRATSSVDIPPADRRWVTVGVKPQQTERLPAMELSQMLSEKGLLLEKFTKFTARGLSVPAAKPALLIKNDSKIMFKVRHGQRLGGLPEEEVGKEPGGSQPESPGGRQQLGKEPRSRLGAGARPEEEKEEISRQSGRAASPGGGKKQQGADRRYSTDEGRCRHNQNNFLEAHQRRL